MLNPVGGVWVFLHDQDAAAGQGNDEGTIAEPVELAAEWEAGIRKES